MKIRQQIDAALWPHLRHRSVYVMVLVAYFAGLGASVALDTWPWWLAPYDLAATALTIFAIGSRDRYVRWRDAYGRYRGARSGWRS